MTEFFRTAMGRTFYEHTMPQLVRALDGLNKKLDLIHGQNKEANEEFFKHAAEAREENGEVLEMLQNASELSRRACEMAGALQQLLWCDGEDTEHDSDTLGEVANITRRYGFGPGNGTDPKELWDDDLIQFARLIYEVQANSVVDLKELANSMDLPWERVNELFDRAEAVWEESKRRHCPLGVSDEDSNSP